MKSVEYFTIIFQKQEPCFFPGETVVGNVKLKVNERFKINSLKCKIHGYTLVYWTERRKNNHNNDYHTVTYTDQQDFFNFQINFLTKVQGSDLYLEVGDYSYPFQFNLPINLPTSFEHEIGKTRYTIEGTIDIPWAFDKHSRRSFTVISLYDLNQNPASRQSFGVSDSKTVCCGPCKSGPITANFGINRCGFCSGERIEFHVTIDNQSNRTIKPMLVELQQLIIFKAVNKSRQEKRSVAKIKYFKSINEHTNEVWSDGSLIVPPVCSSSSFFGSIIDIKYYLNLNFDASGLAVSKDLSIPIIIGNIPLRADMNMPQYNQPMPMPSAPFNPYADINISPPSYQECMFDPNSLSREEKKGELLEDDEKSFKPLYPVFKDQIQI